MELTRSNPSSSIKMMLQGRRQKTCLYSQGICRAHIEASWGRLQDWLVDPSYLIVCHKIQKIIYFYNTQLNNVKKACLAFGFRMYIQGVHCCTCIASSPMPMVWGTNNSCGGCKDKMVWWRLGNRDSDCLYLRRMMLIRYVRHPSII